MEPTTNGTNGRGPGGRFAPGNPGGPGNPHAKRTAELRAAALAAVSDDDLRAVVAKLLELAKGGDLAAIRELLDRLLGKAAALIEIQGAVELDATPDDRRQRLAELTQRLTGNVFTPEAGSHAPEQS